MTHNIETEFGKRLVVLNNGGSGIRAGLTCEVRQVDGTEELDFVASDESVDRYNEVIKLDGWQLDNYRRNPVVVDSHDYSSVIKVIGRSTRVDVAAGQLVNRVQFAMDNPLGKIAYGMAKGGFIKSESVGFIPIEWTRGNEAQGEPYRTFTKSELIEISLVAVPANPGATIGMALKTGAISRRDLKELFNVLRDLSAGENPQHQREADPLADARAAGLGIDAAQLRDLLKL